MEETSDSLREATRQFLEEKAEESLFAEVEAYCSGCGHNIARHSGICPNCRMPVSKVKQPPIENSALFDHVLLNQRMREGEP